MEGPTDPPILSICALLFRACARALLNHSVKQKGSAERNSQAKTSSGYCSSTKPRANIFPWDSRLFQNKRFGSVTRSWKFIRFPEACFVFVSFKNP